MKDKIKTARTSVGLSQRALAQLIGVSYQYVQDWEYGKFKPKLPYLMKLAKATNKPLEYFIEES